MQQNRFQKLLYPLITVIITVHAFVFYSLYVVNGEALKSAAGADSVLGAIGAQGGVYAFGGYLPIWAILLIEFCFAFTLELFFGAPCSARLARRNFDPASTRPALYETAIVSATVTLMCPAMSLIAAALYYPYYAGFRFLTFLADWFRLVCFNFPFALFSQLFFIQPFMRGLFGLIFRKNRTKETQRDNEKRPDAASDDLSPKPRRNSKFYR